jgi:ribonuclease P protein subunit RPR2
MKGQGRRSKPAWQQEIAEERVRILFGLAGEEFPSKPKRSDRYVDLARKIGMRYNVSIPRELRPRFCKSCYAYLVPGKNSVTRTSGKTQSLETKCLGCGSVSRHPYSKEKAC